MKNIQRWYKIGKMGMIGLLIFVFDFTPASYAFMTMSGPSVSPTSSEFSNIHTFHTDLHRVSLGFKNSVSDSLIESPALTYSTRTYSTSKDSGFVQAPSRRAVLALRLKRLFRLTGRKGSNAVNAILLKSAGGFITIQETLTNSCDARSLGLDKKGDRTLFVSPNASVTSHLETVGQNQILTITMLDA